MRKISTYRTDAEKNRQNNFALLDQIKAIKDAQDKYTPKNTDEINQRIRDYKDQIEKHNRDRSSYDDDCKGKKDSISSLKN